MYFSVSIHNVVRNDHVWQPTAFAVCFPLSVVLVINKVLFLHSLAWQNWKRQSLIFLLWKWHNTENCSSIPQTNTDIMLIFVIRIKVQTFHYSLPILLQTCLLQSSPGSSPEIYLKISKECLNNWFMRFIKFSLKATPVQLPCTVRSK